MHSEKPEILEAEIVPDFHTTQAKRTILHGEVSPLPSKQPLQANTRPAWHTPGDHARPKGDLGGLLSGFWVLAVGFIVTVFVLLVSICIFIPFSLLMRLCGVHKNK